MKTILIGWGFILSFVALLFGLATLYYAEETKRWIAVGMTIIITSITAALWLTDIIL